MYESTGCSIRRFDAAHRLGLNSKTDCARYAAGWWENSTQTINAYLIRKKSDPMEASQLLRWLLGVPEQPRSYWQAVVQLLRRLLNYKFLFPILSLFSSTDPATRLVSWFTVLVLAYICISGTARYGRFIASLVKTVVQLLLLVACFLILLTYRDNINEMTKRIAAQLEL